MLPFASSFLAISASFIVPALFGLMIVAVAAKFVRPVYLAAFAIGIYLWFFSDTLGGAASLDVNAGLSGGFPLVLLFMLFVLGALLVFALDSEVFSSSRELGGLGLAIPLLVAFAVGVHGFGEGAAFSSTAAATPSTNILDAFGGVASAAAFILHKLLEPMMAGAVYCFYSKEQGQGVTGLARDAVLLTFAFAIPGLIGAATDYSMNYDTTYPFAFGLGTSLYAAARLAKPIFSADAASRTMSLRIALSALLGFTCIYIAALLHS